MKKLFILTIFAFYITSCQSVSNLFSSSDDDKKIVGKRISVIDDKSTIQIDEELSRTNISPAKITNISSWNKTDGFQAYATGNLQLNSNFNSVKKIKFGSKNNLKGSSTASPVIDNNKIFTISDRGVVYAFDFTTTYEKIWSTQLNSDSKGFYNSYITAKNDRLFITTGTNDIFSLDQSSGKIIWRRHINSISRATPEVADNTAYILTVDNKLYALDASKGSIKWIHEGAAEEVSVMGGASPLTVGHYVIVSYSSGDIFVLSKETGNEVANINLSSDSSLGEFNFDDIDASPIHKGDIVYAISSDGVILALNIKTGETLWDRSIAGFKTPWLMDNYLYVLSRNGDVICLETNSGAVKWIASLPRYEKPKKKKTDIYWFGPIVAGGNVIVSNSIGEIVKLDVNNGKILGKIDIAKGNLSQPIIVNGKMIIRNDSGSIFITN